MSMLVAGLDTLAKGRFLHVISFRFAGELRPIVRFNVPPWSAISRVWPLVWLPEQTAYQLPLTRLMPAALRSNPSISFI